MNVCKRTHGTHGDGPFVLTKAQRRSVQKDCPHVFGQPPEQANVGEKMEAQSVKKQHRGRFPHPIVGKRQHKTKPAKPLNEKDHHGYDSPHQSGDGSLIDK